MAHGLTKRQEYDILYNDLHQERSSFLSLWVELADYIAPERLRYLLTETNKGKKKRSKIIDDTAGMSLEISQSGMMSGMSSPARPWFRLTTYNPKMAEYSSVKEWLYSVTSGMQNVFLRSNIYTILREVYGDVTVFDIAAMLIEEDIDNTIHCTSLPIGSYMVGQDDKGKVNAFAREFRYTVRQVVEKFAEKDEKGEVTDWSNISPLVRNFYDTKRLDAWVDIRQIIKENPDYKPDNPFSKKYLSCYFESNIRNEKDGKEIFLKEEGYSYFPILCIRLGNVGEDIYGSCSPGMRALGTIKDLQLMSKRYAQAVSKMVIPPMVAPISMQTMKASILSGDITFVDEREGKSAFRPAHEVNPKVLELLGRIDDARRQIKKFFHEDLFLMFASSDRRQITAREVAEKKEEKFLLSPFLEQFNLFFDGLMDIVFDIMNRQGLIPPPPQELEGMPLKIEYISVMAQAQKMIGIEGIERFTQFSSEVVKFNPESLDKVDTDQMLDIYSDMVSIPPGIVRSDDKVAEIRQARAEAMQIQREMEMKQMEAKSMRDLSQTSLEGKNALTQIVGAGA